jgi:hypothetical protein
MDSTEPEKRRGPGNPGVGKERRAELVSRMLAGEDARSLAEKVGHSVPFLLRLINEAVRASEDGPNPLQFPAWFHAGSKGSTTPEQREEMVRRALAGEKLVDIGKEFNVTRAYVSLLKNQALDPERFVRRSKFTKKLKPDELNEFANTLASSTPTDHDLIPHSDHWSLDHGYQLAEKLFKKRPSKRVVTECLAPYIQERRADYFPRPQPPKKPHPSQIHPDLAKDPDFVAYYMSPLAQRIAQKEYELALADYEARFATAEERAKIAAEKAALAPRSIKHSRKRVGKHAHSKGSPFTPPKRKKKR